ncbi:MAG: sulfatase-like hydrolase/transferase, partial [Planctomycetes bacterium]|nr:sulfatase-like hydrolase/transferase [Planctomycetota bacterium]
MIAPFRLVAQSAAILLLGVSLAAAQQTEAARDVSRPNIIFMMADDLGYGDIGPFGQKLIATPQLDRMAAEGTKFTHCYTGSPVCAPSRSVLMTGQHTGHTRVRGNAGLVGGVGRERRVPLEDQDVTVAEVLKQAGYATGITGKWGLGEPDTSGVPTRQGFDEWLGFLNQNHAVDYYTDYLWHNETRRTLEGNTGGRKGEYAQEVFTQFALDFIRRHQARPFFLYLAWTTPHADREVPDLGSYADRDWPADARVTAAMISRLDADVGRIFTLLKELGLDERTIVFFCSDNGVGHTHGRLFDSTPNLRGAKGDVYEGGMRTPMLVRWPGHVPAGATSDA